MKLYTTVTGGGEAFHEECTRKINEGWQLAGFTSRGADFLVQAFVKDEAEPDLDLFGPKKPDRESTTRNAIIRMEERGTANNGEVIHALKGAGAGHMKTHQTDWLRICKKFGLQRVLTELDQVLSADRTPWIMEKHLEEHAAVMSQKPTHDPHAVEVDALMKRKSWKELGGALLNLGLPLESCNSGQAIYETLMTNRAAFKEVSLG